MNFQWVNGTRTAGELGNSIGVSICATGQAYKRVIGNNSRVNDNNAAVGDTTITVDDVDVSGAEINVGDIISFTSDAGLVIHLLLVKKELNMKLLQLTLVLI